MILIFYFNKLSSQSEPYGYNKGVINVKIVLLYYTGCVTRQVYIISGTTQKRSGLKVCYYNEKAHEVHDATA